MRRRLNIMPAMLLVIVVAVSLTVASADGLSHSPKGVYALGSSGRCGAYTGSEDVEASKERRSSDLGVEVDLDIVTCQKHLRDHATKLVHSTVGGANVEFAVFANHEDQPESSANFDRSSSSKSSSDSSPAQSSSSDSTAPESTTVSFIVRLTPLDNRRRQRARALLETFVTFVPTVQDVAKINAWLIEFANRIGYLLVDGRNSVTAGSFRKESNGVVFFTVYIITTAPDAAVARVVELGDFPSSETSLGTSLLSAPQECDVGGGQVGFEREEDLAAQLSSVPPPGCSNPLEPPTVPPPDAPVDSCPSDKEVLVSVGSLLSGTPTDWTADNTLCAFEGVTCDTSDDSIVTELVIDNLGIAGPLPASLSCLAGLEKLELRDNSFNGNIPPQWSALSNVNEILLYDNKLTGTLPPEWSVLTGITKIDLDDNKLSGTLPPEWSTLSSLETLDLHDNDLSGTLPPEWSALSSLETLDVDDSDNLSGSLPPEWSALTGLISLDINGGGGLSGSLPPEWSALTSLKALNLDDNDFSGTLPPHWSALTSIEALVLGENKLSGSLPPEWSALTSLKLLSVYDSDVSGTLPPQWSTLTSAFVIGVSDNLLTGTLPPEWSALASIESMDLSGNSLSAPLPVSWTKLGDTLEINYGGLDLRGNPGIVISQTNNIPPVKWIQVMPGKFKIDGPDR